MDDTFIREAQVEMVRRGVSGKLVAADIRALRRYQAQGMSAVEAGAQRAMDIIREG